MTSTLENEGFNFDIDVHHPTKEALMKHNNSGLVVLCQRIETQSGDDLINVDYDPWKAMPREHSKAKAKMFREEVVRRHDVLHLAFPKPRSNNWTMETCQQWLDKNQSQTLMRLFTSRIKSQSTRWCKKKQCIKTVRDRSS